ncbi:MAG: ABC transporter ATP-binding protein [Candidatus Omnitrophica bacterium]|nr:ABC transporter ATP-binding protein [Candidatus Omnitrophota bacterium]
MIKLEGIGKKYPVLSPKAKAPVDFWALKDLSFEVGRGKVIGVIGRNGAGKTTLLNVMAGVLPPTEGKVSVAGKVLGLFNLGVGFQDELTGRENIFLNGTLLGASRDELEVKFANILGFSEIGDFIDMPLGTYSQGMRLRLAFSIIANLDFEALLMDEVLAVGDALFQSKCYERLMDFKRAGKTLILTTQAMDMIERLCDEAFLLDHGELVFSGSPEETANRYRSLLNAEQFFVGPAKSPVDWEKNTQKWANDVVQWGKKLGSREAVIDSVNLFNHWGLRCNKVRSGRPFKVRVGFTVRDTIREPHFGVALFRQDGLYCYGPNTSFDGHTIKEILPGRGWFELRYRECLLGPGDYKISVAIWDRDETLPFDYHDGCYDLKVLGPDSRDGGLLNLSCEVNGRRCEHGVGIPVMEDGAAREGSGVKIVSLEWRDAYGIPKEILKTRETAVLKLVFAKRIPDGEGTHLWVGLFREDDVYCQGFVTRLYRESCYRFAFRELPLLPGGYKWAAGVWDAGAQKFLMRRDPALSFRVISDKKDHGTVHLDHEWKWNFRK